MQLHLLTYCLHKAAFTLVAQHMALACLFHRTWLQKYHCLPIIHTAMHAYQTNIAPFSAQI